MQHSISAQDDERTSNTKAKRASDDTDNGLGQLRSIVAKQFKNRHTGIIVKKQL